MFRSALLTVLLVACPPSDGPSDPVEVMDDSVFADSDPLAREQDAVDTDAPCVVALDQPTFPLTWAEVDEAFADRCVMSWRCAGPGEAVAVSESQCFSYQSGYYDASGQLVAEAEGHKQAQCSEHGFAVWAGYEVTTCELDLDAVRYSPGCATPNVPPPPVTNAAASPPALPEETWVQAQERLADVCHGLLTCPLSTGETLAVVAISNGPCAAPRFEVFDVAGAHVGAPVNPFLGLTLWLPGATREQLAELTACLARPYMPSAACGTVRL